MKRLKLGGQESVMSKKEQINKEIKKLQAELTKIIDQEKTVKFHKKRYK